MSRLPRPPTPQLKTVLYLFVATLFILSPIITPLAASHDVPDYRYGVFFSDDKDAGSASSEATDYSAGDYVSAEGGAKTAGQRSDYYFDQTSPNVSIGDSTLNFDDWRRERLDAFEFERHNSRSPIYNCVPQGKYEVNGTKHATCSGTQEPKRSNWKYMKDAHTTILGAQGATEISYKRIDSADNRNKNDGSSERNDQVWAIPSSGEVYVQSDFRLDYGELNAYSCTEPDWEYVEHTHEYTYYVYNETTGDLEERTGEFDERHKVDGDQTCTKKIFDETSVVHSLQVRENGNWETIKTVRDEDKAGATIPYDDLRTDTRQQMRVQTEFHLTIETTVVEKDWDQDTAWSTVSEEVSHSSREKSTTSRWQPVNTLTNKELTVKQTVVDIENYDQTYLEIEVEGPQDQLEQRRFWSRMYLGECTDYAPAQYRTCGDNQYITNTWGVYSSRQYEHMRLLTDDNNYIVHQPNQFTMLRATSRGVEPSVRVVDSEKAYTRAKFVTVQTENVTGGDMPVLEENVTLRQAPPNVVTEMTLRGAPGRVTRVEDLHGNSIANIQTETVPGRVPEIDLIERDGNEVQVYVTDPETGEPLTNRKVFVSGAEEQSVFTDRRGIAVVTRDSSYLEVRTRSDEFGTDKDLYYVSAVAEKSYYTNPVIMDLFFETLSWTMYATPFIGLYMWLRYMRNDRDGGMPGGP